MRRLTQIMPAHIAADGIDLVGSSVLPTHFEPMGVYVISKTSNHYDIANATSQWAVVSGIHREMGSAMKTSSETLVLLTVTHQNGFAA